LTREELLLRSISRTARLIEIGASVSPIAPKRDGWDTRTIDAGSKEELIEKYRESIPDRISNIEDVDFVWRDGLLLDAIPDEYHGTFDAFVASHVIEHMPDMVAFLQCAETLVKPALGTFILAIPDKRYCFDYFRQPTMTNEVLASHKESRSRHSASTTFGFYGYTASAEGLPTWETRLPLKNFSFAHPIEYAYGKFLEHDEGAPYTDIHAWHFTPASFRLLMLELARLGLTDWRIDDLNPAGFEFHAWLSLGARDRIGGLSEEEVSAQRISLLKQMLGDLKEQIDQLVMD
jgi:hypothetical protein